MHNNNHKLFKHCSVNRARTKRGCRTINTLPPFTQVNNHINLNTTKGRAAKAKVRKSRTKASRIIPSSNNRGGRKTRRTNRKSKKSTSLIVPMKDGVMSGEGLFTNKTATIARRTMDGAVKSISPPPLQRTVSPNTSVRRRIRCLQKPWPTHIRGWRCRYMTPLFQLQ